MGLSAYTITALKEMLKARGLSTIGSKDELIIRLKEADPEVERHIEIEDNHGNQDGDASSAGEQFIPNVYQREAEMYKREKELAERELALLQREMELLRDNRGIERRPNNDNAAGIEMQTERTRASVAAIAELLTRFDGKSDEYEVWERQAKLLKTTYRLNDDATTVMIGLRLKGKALEWFHSKPEHIGMPVNELLEKMRKMFWHRQNKLKLRKTFEDRVWKKDETFHEYLHDKMIKGNRVPINEEELLDYIIDGIPNETLRNQARMQQFETTNAMREAFEKITLHDKNVPKIEKDGKRRNDSTNEGAENKTAVKEKTGNRRCYNCGGRDHLSNTCPSKDRGAKCFKCNEHGHIAAKCTKKLSSKDSCTVLKAGQRKCLEKVIMDGIEVEALIDSASDVTLMQASEYIKRGAPRFEKDETMIRGVGSKEIKTLGKFKTEINIDGCPHPIHVHVIADAMIPYPLLIGIDFLNNFEVTIKAGKTTIKSMNSPIKEADDLPEIFNIEVVNTEPNNTTVADAHIKDENLRAELHELVNNYTLQKTQEIDVKMKIILTDDKPVYQRARRISPNEKTTVNVQISKWIEEGVARPSSSDYASPIVLVRKKNGTHRLCVDYRMLNKKIIKDRYPLPLIDDQLDALQGAKIFSTLDLRDGFFHVEIEESSRKYTAFIVPDGHYEFCKVPFGLCNSPAIFQRFINTAFKKLIQEGIVLTYMDDLIIPSLDIADGLKRLRRVLDVASRAGLNINWKKCNLLQTRVEFLGHRIEDGRVRPSSSKIDAVRRFPTPVNKRHVQSFLGLSGYFRKFIQGYSKIARPLTRLLKADIDFHFDEEEENAFNRLKTILTKEPVLALYRVGAETQLHTDASKQGYGAILLQKGSEDQCFHPVYYASGTTTPTEERYASYDLEVLAIYKALKKFRSYLLGIPFTIVTDCRAFTQTMNKRDLCVRVARWALLLEEFNYTIVHRPGKSMSHTDALSRNPLPTCMVIEENETWLAARLRKAQNENDELQKIRESIRKNQATHFVERGGLIFRENKGSEYLVVPQQMQYQIIRRMHEQGHFSAAKTEDLIKANYWISDLRPKIEKVVRNCLTCILAEKKHGKQECLLSPIEKGCTPLDTLHIDHLGPLPSTAKSYRHVLVVVDAFSKFTWLYATKTTSTAEVLTHLRKQAAIFCNPRRMVSDRGTAFTSKDFKEYCEAEDIEHQLITTGLPRGNGQVERVNRTLIPLLTKLASPKAYEWYKYLSLAQQMLNTVAHRSIGMSPFRLLFGTHPRLKDRPDIREMLEEEWITTFQDSRDELRVQAKNNITRIQRENKRNYDRKRKRAKDYIHGDLIAIKRTQQGPGQKLTHKFLGPYEVTKVLRRDRYLVTKIGEQEGPLKTTTSADHMKPWVHEDYPPSEDEEPEVIRGE